MVAMFEPFIANNGSLAQPTEFFLLGLFTLMLLKALAHYKLMKVLSYNLDNCAFQLFYCGVKLRHYTECNRYDKRVVEAPSKRFVLVLQLDQPLVRLSAGRMTIFGSCPVC